MYRQFHQEFLLNCDYQTIRLDNYFMEPTDIRDHALKLSISELDRKIGTEKDWLQFVEQLPDDKTIVIINDRPQCHNPIYKEFNDNTQKAYLFRLKKAGISCGIIGG